LGVWEFGELWNFGLAAGLWRCMASVVLATVESLGLMHSNRDIFRKHGGHVATAGGGAALQAGGPGRNVAGRAGFVELRNENLCGFFNGRGRTASREGRF